VAAKSRTVNYTESSLIHTERTSKNIYVCVCVYVREREREVATINLG